MATLTSGSWGTTTPGTQSTPGSVGQEAQRRAKERTKRRAEEIVSESRSTSEDEEDKDPVTLSSDEEEYVGSETPSQSNPVDDSELPPFKIHRPISYSLYARKTYCQT